MGYELSVIINFDNSTYTSHRHNLGIAVRIILNKARRADMIIELQKKQPPKPRRGDMNPRIMPPPRG